MGPSISHRVSIAWPPSPPSEPTSTLVLTSPLGRFVDLRLTKDKPPSLSWAFYGVAHYWTDCKSRNHGSWSHEVDSRIIALNLEPEPEAEDDTGILKSLENGDELEVGSMKDDSGVVREYEEVWRAEEPNPRVWKVWKFNHVADDAFNQGMMIRLGRWAQGIVRRGKILTSVRAQLVDMSGSEEPDDVVWRIEFIGGDKYVAEEMMSVLTETYRSDESVGSQGDVPPGVWALIESSDVTV
ncbi:hypothetical protein SISNIDRAFT_461408 [Sistotremastrum niveocremeum HHB9708]|uniref:Protein HRI1 n=2 Tax=Sistotremastraceae TaxID=3402574 RepID=A0A164MNH4_9AGAM|nr:hypothetical protein SISNIDRAFT_461408 [Sistotremastrum niveocremeum HHB9708]KZT38536.1 hypothetical protein SISSUDRAFT_1046822 [Sistotremastrum suecicum HHB10207 ss-3]